MDIMYINNDPVLQVVFSATQFIYAKYLNNLRTLNVWKKFVEFWPEVYTGMLNRVRVDRGLCFGDNFMSLAIFSHIDIGINGIEAH